MPEPTKTNTTAPLCVTGNAETDNAIEARFAKLEARIAAALPSTTATRDDVAKATPPPAGEEHILQYFAFAHLPPQLQEVSEPFSALAHAMVSRLPRNPERTVALRKLLEAKDAAVRARVAK